MMKLRNQHCSLSSLATRKQQYSSSSSIDPASTGTLILQTPDPRALTRTLHSDHRWTPEVVQTILNRLWNHAPKALAFFDILDNHPCYSHNTLAFDTAIDLAARMRDYRSVWRLLSRMSSRGKAPRGRTFAIIAERLVSAGKVDMAVRLFLTSHQYGFEPDLSAFNTFLDVVFKAGKAEVGFKMFMMLRGKFRPDVVTYNVVVNGFCLVKETNRAMGLLREMVGRGLEPSLVTYNTMLKGFFRAGRVEDAWDFFLQMKRRKVEVDVVSYTTVVHGFGAVGQVGKARKVFDEMIDAGVLPSVATYNALIQVICWKDAVENAVLLFEKMLEKGYVPNAITYNAVIRGLCRAGKMDEAVKYMNRMKTDDCEPNIHTYNLVIRYYCCWREVEKGLEIFESMRGGACLPNLDTYNILIKAMFFMKKSDDLLVAGRLLVEMVDRGFQPRRYTFNKVLDGLLLTGNQDFAREILRHQSKLGRVPIEFKI